MSTIKRDMGHGGSHVDVDIREILTDMHDGIVNTIIVNGSATITDEILSAGATAKIWDFANDNVVKGTESFKLTGGGAIDVSDVASVAYAFRDGVSVATVTFVTDKTAPTATYDHIAVMPVMAVTVETVI